MKPVVTIIAWLSLLNTGYLATTRSTSNTFASAASDAPQLQINYPIPEISNQAEPKVKNALKRGLQQNQVQDHQQILSNDFTTQRDAIYGTPQDPNNNNIEQSVQETPSSATARANVNTMAPTTSPTFMQHSIPPSTQGKMEEEAVADAFVRGGAYSNENYGNSTILMVKNDGRKSSNRKAILKFDLGNISFPEEPYAVALRIYVAGRMGSDAYRIVTISRLANTDWKEDNVTWANLVPDVAQTGSSFNITASYKNTWIDMDVTDIVEKNNTGVVALMLENLGESSRHSSCSFASRESGLPPTLVVSPVDEDSINATTWSASNETGSKGDGLAESNMTSSENQTDDSLVLTEDVELAKNGSDSEQPIQPQIVTSSGTETNARIQEAQQNEVPSSSFDDDNGLSSVAVTATSVAATLVTIVTVYFAFSAVPSYFRQRTHKTCKIGNSGLELEVQLSDEGTYTDRDFGSDGSSVASMTDDDWFRILTCFQNKGGSGLGGSVQL